MDDDTERSRQEAAVAEEEERRGVPRTTTTGDPRTDVRQPGAGAIADLEQPASYRDPELPEQIRRGPRRPAPAGRTRPEDDSEDDRDRYPGER